MQSASTQLKSKNYPYIISLIAIVAILLMPGIVFSQTTIEGKVTYNDDVTPASFATIEISNRKGIETMTSYAGNFLLRVPDSRSDDTVVISAVGYKSIKLPVRIASNRSKFILSKDIKNIEGVTVFNSHEVIGSNSETVGYYRSWDSKKTGGEIGRIFKLSYKKFKIDKIRFKAGNTCDTCLLRLHIRKVVDGYLPGEEILTDSVSLFVNNLSLDTKIPEFDLTPYDLTLSEKEFFFGIEVLNCGNGKKGFCSFSFAGTEKGEYVFKSKAEGEWKTTDDYTIYLKLFLRF